MITLFVDMMLLFILQFLVGFIICSNDYTEGYDDTNSLLIDYVDPDTYFDSFATIMVRGFVQKSLRNRNIEYLKNHNLFT